MSKDTSVVPNRTAIASESESSFPAGSPDAPSRNAGILTDWLGSFWSAVYEDPEFIRYVQDARSLRAAQLYLDLLENLKLEDRQNAPVFHRERWHPVILRKSTRNTGSKGMFRLSGDGTVRLGVQDESKGYRPDTRITLGGTDANYKGMVVDPLEGESAGMVDAATCACNSIVDAGVVLGRGTGFAILDGAIAIAEDLDPFDSPVAGLFPKFDIVADDPKDNDEETVLWVSDALFDRNFISTALGYAIGLPGKSSETYKRVVNAAWNAVASGATPLLLRSLVASICGIPTVREDGEVVERVVRSDDMTLQVVTDRNVYTFPSKEVVLDGGGTEFVNYTELRKDVVPGAALKRFDTLDKAIRVYECVTDADRAARYSEFIDDFDEFTEDVPAVDLPPALFRPQLEGGFSVGWAEEDVVCVGFFDKERRLPKLMFHMEGSESDERVFWEDVWEAYAESGVSMETCLEGVDYDNIFEPGKVCGRISPMKFFMRNLIGANTLILTVRTDTLADDAPLYDPKFFGVVRSCIPSYIRLFVIEHETAYDDEYDTSGESGSGTSVEDDAEMYAYDEYDDDVRYGGGRRGPSYSDRVSSKWVAACRDKDEYDD